MLDRLKSILGGSAPGKTPSETGSWQEPAAEPYSRHSNGLEQFFASISNRHELRILDFSGASQANITYITSMGHGLQSLNFVQAIESTFGRDDYLTAQSDPMLVDQFVAENLDFPPDHFDGALVWDSLQYLSPHLLQLTMDRLFDTLRPEASALAFFHADERMREAPVYQYRIGDHHSLSLTLRGMRKPAQVFNNRALEKLFHRFGSIKFFLARDALREIIARR